MELTPKQQSVVDIKKKITADPSLSVSELCEKAGISTSYYYNSHASKRAKKEAKQRAAPLPVTSRRDVVSYRVEPAQQPTLIPPGYAAVVLMPVDQLFRGMAFMQATTGAIK